MTCCSKKWDNVMKGWKDKNWKPNKNDSAHDLERENAIILGNQNQVNHICIFLSVFIYKFIILFSLESTLYVLIFLHSLLTMDCLDVTMDQLHHASINCLMHPYCSSLHKSLQHIMLSHISREYFKNIKCCKEIDILSKLCRRRGSKPSFTTMYSI